VEVLELRGSSKIRASRALIRIANRGVGIFQIQEERTMSEGLNIAALMEKLPQAFMPEKAGDLDAVVQFNLEGEQAGKWFVTIKNGKCAVETGTANNPRLTLNADTEVLLDVFTGKVNPMQAFAAGQFKLKGDLGLSMKLLNFFKL
jgi:putative sterol carrier protein